VRDGKRKRCWKIHRRIASADTVEVARRRAVTAGALTFAVDERRPSRRVTGQDAVRFEESDALGEDLVQSLMQEVREVL
jgi:hypothetical protein